MTPGFLRYFGSKEPQPGMGSGNESASKYTAGNHDFFGMNDPRPSVQLSEKSLSKAPSARVYVGDANDRYGGINPLNMSPLPTRRGPSEAPQAVINFMSSPARKLRSPHLLRSRK